METGMVPRLRVYNHMLVHTLRSPETPRDLLLPSLGSLVFREYLSIRPHPNRWLHAKVQWMEMDLHY